MATPGDWRGTLQPGERLAVQQKMCVPFALTPHPGLRPVR
jgi:hypothetical protein